MDERAGDIFQQSTKYHPDRMNGHVIDWQNVPETYKVYRDCRRLKLPAAEIQSSVAFDIVLRHRKSIRRFTKKPVSLEQLSYLLWAATGIQRLEDGYEFRTAPSAGALYPIETYIVANNVEGLAQGVYHYAVKDHSLEELKVGDYSRCIAAAALGQSVCSEAAAVFIWTAVFNRSKWKYGQRAYRYIYLDAGHIGSNLTLSAVSLGLGSCQIAAIYDDEVNKMLDLDGIEESAIYMSVVGYPFARS
jgi:SagB-type dehydrogenase family enzyme